MADFTPQSRNEAILYATINGTEYTAPPQSRIEDLLVQLKNKIEQGGRVIIDDAMSDSSTNAVENKTIKAYVDDEIDKAIDACYHPAGSKTCAELISSLLIADNLGNVYNTTDTGTTTSDFVEGAGETIDLGSDVAIVNVGTSERPIYKFNVLGGFVDLSKINEDISNLQTTVSKNGAKNLLPMTLEGIKNLNTIRTWSGNAYTVNGVTFTVNTDSNGNITGIATSGTAGSGGVGLSITTKDSSDEYLETGSYIMTGCPNGGSGSKYKIGITNGSGTGIGDDFGCGVSLNIANYEKHTCYIFIFANTNSTGLTFYPMIRLASDTDSTFQPYAKTNLELTDDVRDIDYRLEENACVNLLDIYKCVSVTASVIRYPAMNFLANKGETFYFTFNSGATRQIAYAITDSNGTTTYDSGWLTEGRHVITMPADGSIFVAFKYSDNSTITINDVIETFKPMLSRIDGAEYMPYYPSNKELGKWIPKTKTFSGTTNTNGNLEIGDYPKMVITSIEFTSSTGYPVALPMKINGHIDLHVINGATNEKLANTTVSGTLYYYEI